MKSYWQTNLGHVVFSFIVFLVYAIIIVAGRICFGFVVHGSMDEGYILGSTYTWTMLGAGLFLLIVSLIIHSLELQVEKILVIILGSLGVYIAWVLGLLKDRWGNIQDEITRGWYTLAVVSSIIVLLLYAGTLFIWLRKRSREP